jgi:thymidylate synthase
MGAVNIIVAVGNYVPEKGYPIGRKGGLPWSCKEDLKWFREITENHAVIMGRTTYNTIGKPLKNRTNIVITSKPLEYNGEESVHTATSIENAIDLAKSLTIGDIFIIGGASVYKYVLEHNLVDKIYIDFLAETIEDADAFFSYKEYGDWEEDGKTTEVLKGKAYAKTYMKINGKNNHVDEQYLNLVNEIIQYGEEKDTRAGKTRSLFGKQLRFNLKDGLPMLTTKKMFTKGVLHELLWFIKGDTNIKYLVDNGVHIWDDDAYRYFRDKIAQNNSLLEEYDKDLFLENVKNNAYVLDVNGNNHYKFGDLNRVYGYQWTNWGGHNQIKEVINTLKTNPDDRRMIISAWNVEDIPNMALPPCHFCCQFYTKKMTEEERWNYFEAHMLKEDNEEGCFNLYVSRGENYLKGSLVAYLDRMNVPSRKLSCMWHQRSVDVLLGLPFNIMSYAVFTHMIAQCVNMDVDELIFNGGDVHVYENQIETYLSTQKLNHPKLYSLPTLVLNKDIKNINDFTYDDIKIDGYQSYSKISYPLSVGL